MKSMEELVLDRLIEEAERPLQLELQKAKTELSVEAARGNALAQTYRDAMATLERETAKRRLLQKDAAEADAPLTNLYQAAEEVRRLNATDAPRSELRAAISKLGSAMMVAEKYIDLIPF